MLTACEQAVGTLWEDVSGYEWLAEGAATELAALEAVARVLKNVEWEANDDWGAYCPECKGYKDRGHEDYCELAAALAELEKQEPDGCVITGKLGERCSFHSTDVKKGDTVYTSQREWVGLGEREILELWRESADRRNSQTIPERFADAIQTKLRELNMKGLNHD